MFQTINEETFLFYIHVKLFFINMKISTFLIPVLSQEEYQHFTYIFHSHKGDGVLQIKKNSSKEFNCIRRRSDTQKQN